MVLGRCPRCRKGSLFTHNLYSTRFTSINEKCPVCDLRFEIEPGFFYGAMYISYAMVVALVITTGFTLFLFLGDPSLLVYAVTITALILFFLPIIFRYSKILYLYWFGGIKYHPDSAR